MIVRNEEDNIENCLKSAQGKVDEIIIVDTGSSDRTKEIALKYTNKVYDFQWRDDFSKARNYSISKASNDWVLVLDGDEVIESFNKEKIMEQIDANNDKIGKIKIINVFEDDKGEKKYIERISRLFNKTYYYYEGIIHEQLVPKGINKMCSWDVDLIIKHIGYTKEVIRKTNKLHRNISLLKKTLETNENDPYIYYQLGKSYYMKKNFFKASEYFEIALSFHLDFKLEYAEDLVETYGYSMVNSGQLNKALAIKKYEKYYSNSSDFNFFMGIASMNNTLFQEAINYFNKAVVDKQGSIEGVNSFLPNYNIGVIYECLGYTSKALDYYLRCGDYVQALKRIKHIS
ncbi:tetratricopeptide repeat-containing glycosyltransferase family 2 protein [Clostridium akagii]|uniref:tetratricopeptide repeat-containing glycosyltransferase family 2 protein n=1 Tax=Clostridium akagii TaxID=91623 RepID=UPI00068A565E|nr:glycosyltransferase family 2 protein [Clostridium akagii]